MKKTVLKKVTLLMSCLFVLSFLQPNLRIVADEIDVPVEIDDDLPYEYVQHASCELSISSGNASVSSLVTGNSTVTSISVTVYLEKYLNDSWQSYTSWYHTGGAIQDNTDSTSVTHGIYRVHMYVSVATSQGGSESFDFGGNMVMYLL